MTRDEYAAYLRSEHWQRLARAAKDLAGGKCTLCRGTKTLVAHHTPEGYARLGRERIEDLIVLCDACHQRHHQKFRDAEQLAFWMLATDAPAEPTSQVLDVDAFLVELQRLALAEGLYD